MVDPLSLIAIGAAVGGAAGKFVEKAWDSGEKWITAYFANHHEIAVQKATENTADFLNDLAKRIANLEKNKIIPPADIASAQEHPDFSVMLQKAMISAAQTDNKNRHQLLSRLVAERIKAPPESLLALASKMACDAISYTTFNQLKILGLDANILHIQPDSLITEEQYDYWLQARIGPFIGTKAISLDYLHLESLSCLKFESFISRNLEQILASKIKGNFNYNKFIETPLGIFLIDIWEKQKLNSAQLSSIGLIIGVMASDQITGANTNLQGWEII